MKFRFTVMLCTHRPPALLPLAIETVLAQTHTDFELFVVCDGAPPETIACAQSFAARDPRIRVYDFPKGERHGEAHRHAALADARGDFVAHIADDDLWLPDHLKELGAHLARVEFGNLLLVSIGRDGSLHPHAADLAEPAVRRRMLEQRWNFFGPTVAGYRLSTYRRLPQGWSPAPPDVWCDLHMWRKFLRLEGISVGTRFSIQAIALENAGRQGMSLEDRRAETEEWFKVATTSELRADYVARCWASVAKLQTARTRTTAGESEARDLTTRVAALELNVARIAGALADVYTTRKIGLVPSHNAIFVEQLYLDANPDVSDAVRNGELTSGLEHWLAHRRIEGRLLRPFTKTDIINLMADTRRYRTYLEICTPTTGHRFAEVDRSRYTTCHRLMYRCPDSFDDGMNIDFRSNRLDIVDCVQQMQNGPLRYDVVLVDSFHEYEPSFRDLEAAWTVIGQEGTIVVHDCNPVSEEVASPTHIPMSWSGVTYKAYLDFVTGRSDLEYITIDTDEGCGLIQRKNGADALSRADDNTRPAAHEAEGLIDGWRMLGNDFESAFQFLQTHKKPLLKLMSVRDFLHNEKIRQLSLPR